MQIPRVIPLLLLAGETFVKTVRYRDPRYVGDPTNVIDLFNQFEVDEIALLDIGATTGRHEPQYELIRALAAECWVPLAYGGGIRTLNQASRVLASGAEKVVVGTALADTPEVITEIAATFGSQAVVASVDVSPQADDYGVFVEGGQRQVSTGPEGYAAEAVERGAGEILLNAIHRDGTRAGYDLDIIGRVAAAVPVPVVACGGAGSRDDLAKPIEVGAAAVAAGSLFVFSGSGGGVLVNFPSRSQLEQLVGSGQ
jgi:cyclase